MASNLTALFKNKAKSSFVKKIVKGSVVLDVGCGYESPKKTKIINNNIYYIGVDVADHKQSQDVREYADEYIIVDSDKFCDAIRIYEGKCDAVISSHNIEHCEDQECVLEAMVCALKSRGVLYLSFPNPDAINFPSRKGTLNYYDDPTHRKIIETEYVIQKIKDLGMNVIFFEKKYKPKLFCLLGFIFEPMSRFSGKVLPFGLTWAYYGFETIIWAKK